MLGSQVQLTVRGASDDDADALVDVFRESWLNAYRGILPEFHLDRIIRRRNAEWWRTALRSKDRLLVVESAGTIAGYASYGQARVRGRNKGEIYELYLTPVYQGLGFGEHLFEGCRHRLDQRQLPGLIVWALVDNQAACHFYWRRGGRPVASVLEAFGTSKLEKVAFTWP